MRGCALAIRVTTHRFWRVPPGEKKKRKGGKELLPAGGADATLQTPLQVREEGVPAFCSFWACRSSSRTFQYPVWC